MVKCNREGNFSDLNVRSQEVLAVLCHDEQSRHEYNEFINQVMQRTKGLNNIQTSYFDADAQSSKEKAPQVGDPLKVKSKGAPKKNKGVGADGDNPPMSTNGRPL